MTSLFHNRGVATGLVHDARDLSNWVASVSLPVPPIGSWTRLQLRVEVFCRSATTMLLNSLDSCYHKGQVHKCSCFSGLQLEFGQRHAAPSRNRSGGYSGLFKGKPCFFPCIIKGVLCGPGPQSTPSAGK